MNAASVPARMVIVALAALLIAGCRWRPPRPGKPTAPQTQSQRELPTPPSRTRQASDTSDGAWRRAAPRGELPTLARGFYFDGWRATGHAPEIRHKEDFLERVKQLHPGLSVTDRERAVRAVFRLLASHITGGELTQVKHQLPQDTCGLCGSAG